MKFMIPVIVIFLSSYGLVAAEANDDKKDQKKEQKLSMINMDSLKMFLHDNISKIPKDSLKAFIEERLSKLPKDSLKNILKDSTRFSYMPVYIPPDNIDYKMLFYYPPDSIDYKMQYYRFNWNDGLHYKILPRLNK